MWMLDSFAAAILPVQLIFITNVSKVATSYICLVYLQPQLYLYAFMMSYVPSLLKLPALQSCSLHYLLFQISYVAGCIWNIGHWMSFA
jgi:hypothetical protein